ncbi:hypothetical protein GCM10025881_05790 [Pseudolysinimonas kribbensis]|uniref:Enolpyruvate transferase domain-containing protein n=1 Tax=Pseudolysinimonas kribbensis TaxID=433641 RepID=A0ABQ6K2H1_9MICO|nr:hypothetical protein GCM10025881_05790 [Pseudolysinimonas kribbensis]
MGLMRYSDREELPLDGVRARETEKTGPGTWSAPTAVGPLAARLSLPGSKSLTNRELVLAALADAPSVLRRPLHSRDTALMVEALRSLGAGIHEQQGDGAFGADLRIAPGELGGGISIDAGLAGTVMRFIPPVAALALGPVALDGDPAARRRPMRATIQALRDLGVDVADDGRGSLPSPCTARARSRAARSRSTPRPRVSSCRGCCWPPRGSCAASPCGTPASGCRACRTSR